MNSIYRIGLILVMAVCTFGSVHAQKFGYTNSQAILLQMPDVKQADSRLETLQAQLQKKGQQMLESLQGKYASLQKRVDDGLISQVDAQKEAEALAKEEQTLMKFEQDMVNQLTTKREELIKPILDKVQGAIDDVAAQNGYQYIFDTSSGVLLYAKPEDDITDRVKAKLGIN